MRNVERTMEDGGTRVFAPTDAARGFEVLLDQVPALLEVVDALNPVAPFEFLSQYLCRLDVDPLLPHQKRWTTQKRLVTTLSITLIARFFLPKAINRNVSSGLVLWSPSNARSGHERGEDPFFRARQCGENHPSSYAQRLRLGQHQPTQHPTSEELSIGKIKFQAFDLGGRQIARRVWKDYYAQVDAVVYLVDAVDKERFHERRMSWMHCCQITRFPKFHSWSLGTRLTSLMQLRRRNFTIG
ncbi:hypothetical protein HHK36_006950 [Tetracentron sinense]|uniref:Uncharacterized protein n=1 Tax=Tetracentron sinense TaxID=13715 RepID=A0A834ZIE2_TETSI|nr:hypothetical protein HHK36_006950 [Tetracentron sinense]